MWSMKLTQRPNIADILRAQSIKDIAFHSKAVVPGSAFFVIRYMEEYLREAIAKGARLIISEDKIDNLPDSVKHLKVEDVREALGEAAAFLLPNKPKYIVAVTGTNGKTSVVDYFRQICGHIGIKAASIGTMGILCTDRVLEKKLQAEFDYDLTTPDVISMHKMMEALGKAGVTHVAFEASSHGIDQGRLAGIPVSVAVFTNFSQDHLDYHGTMEAYKISKLMLFSKNLISDGIAIFMDTLLKDKEVERYIKELDLNGERLISVGNNGDVKILKAEPTIAGQEIEFTHKNRTYEFKTNIVGSFQAPNLLMAASMVERCGVDFEKIVGVLPLLKAVRGRLERVADQDGDLHVFVDYSHKPLALEMSLMELRKLCHGSRLIALFGCGGNRDRLKRKMMGEIACRVADIVVVTDDNPRMEDAAFIRSEVMQGAKTATEIGGRGEAIKYAIGLMQKGDVLLIAGKGHEDYQIIGDEKFHFDDVEEARKWI